MSWIQKLRAKRAPKRRPLGIAVRHLADAEIAEPDERRRAEIALARKETFEGSQRLPLSHVVDMPSTGDLWVPDTWS